MRLETTAGIALDAGRQPHVVSGNAAPLENAAWSLAPPTCRSVCIGDMTAALRSAWVRRMFPGAQEVACSDDLPSMLAQAGEGFEVLLVHGDDVPRLARLVKSARAVLPSKLLIAAVSRSTPAERARLLRAGADDVADLRMADRELICRVEAMLARIRSRDGADDNTAQLPRSPAYAELERVLRKSTPAERELMMKLIGARGDVVSYNQLERTIEGRFGTRSRRAVQVSICALRKRLNGRVRIENIRGSGYALTLHDDEGAAASRTDTSPENRF